MENQTMKLNDIADDLFILNKHTIDTLFSLENSADCIALYVFLYKTAKWQKTNVIKATEEYIKTSLGWGYDKIRRTKNILTSCGLINKVQYRKDNKIEGWFIEISYLVSKEKELQVLESNSLENLDVGNPTSRNEEINALKYNNICLKNKINMLENKILELEKQNKESVSKDTKEKNKKYITFGRYQRVKLTQEEYDKLCGEFGKTFIDNEIALLDEYVEINNNKGKYKNYNLVLRKAIRENWFKKNNYKPNQQEPQRYGKGLDIDRDIVIDTHPEFDLDDLPY